jgi:hypothetical protein
VQRQYLRRVPVDPVTGWSSWKVLAPAAAGETGVFDIAAPEQPTSAPAVVPEAAK